MFDTVKVNCIIIVWYIQLISKCYSECVWVHVFACVSAPWGSAGVFSGHWVRGQCSFDVERRQWCTGIPSSMGTFYRSGQSRLHQTHHHISLQLWLDSPDLHTLSFLFFYPQRSKCRDCGGSWWPCLLCIVQTAAGCWVHRHYHPTVWGKHWGPWSPCQV